VLDRLVTVRGRAPRFIRCDNGPELTANALRDWCRFTGAGTSYIEYDTVRPHSALGYLTRPITPRPGQPPTPHPHSGWTARLNLQSATPWDPHCG
jgi:hypothetical protein